MSTTTDVVEVLIPKNNKQKIFCCSIRFGGCGFVNYQGNIPKSSYSYIASINLREVLCPMCLENSNENDMLTLTFVNFKTHTHEANYAYVKALLDASGIKEDWIFRI